MFAGIIVRVVASIFLVFHLVIFIAAAINSLRSIMARSEDTNMMFVVVFLLLSLVFAVWVWGMLQKVFKKDWPRKLFIRLKTDWRNYVATLLILIGLALLFGSPIGFYASIGHVAGSHFAQLARAELVGLLSVDLPGYLLKLVAWTFQWHFASLMVGFCVWVYTAILNAKKATKKEA